MLRDKQLSVAGMKKVLDDGAGAAVTHEIQKRTALVRRALQSIFGVVRRTTESGSTETWQTCQKARSNGRVAGEAATLLRNYGTYYSDIPRVLTSCPVFLSQRRKASEVLLCDGLQVANTFKKNHADAYRLLSTVGVKWCCVVEGHRYECVRPVIVPVAVDCANGAITDVQIRFSEEERSPLTLSKDLPDSAAMQKYYDALATFRRVLNVPGNTITLSILPSDILLVDNHRILQGRAPFSGLRVLTEACVAEDDFWASARCHYSAVSQSL